MNGKVIDYEKREKILALREKEGLLPSALAERFGMSRNQIQYHLGEVRKDRIRKLQKKARMSFTENKKPDGKNTWTVTQNEAMAELRQRTRRRRIKSVKLIEPESSKFTEPPELFVQDLDAKKND